MWDEGLDIVRCAGCRDVIAHHEHLWIEDEDGGLRRWSPGSAGEARLTAARRAWHPACVGDDLRLGPESP
jgi:hypothetical protein